MKFGRNVLRVNTPYFQDCGGTAMTSYRVRPPLHVDRARTCD